MTCVISLPLAHWAALRRPSGTPGNTGLVCYQIQTIKLEILAMAWREVSAAEGPVRAGKIQFSLDFTASERSIVTFRHVQATPRCESASMPRGDLNLSGILVRRHLRS